MSAIDPTWAALTRDVRLDCSRCGTPTALADVLASPRGAVCRACVQAMPEAEFRELRDGPWNDSP